MVINDKEGCMVGLTIAFCGKSKSCPKVLEVYGFI